MSSGEGPVDRLVAFAAQPPQRDARPPGRTDLALTAAAYGALLVAMFPLLRVVTPGAWTLGVLVLPVLLLATGWIARRYRLPAVAVSLAELVVGLIALTAVFLGPTALFGLIPTPRSFGVAVDFVPEALDTIVNGAAPLEAGAALSFLIVGGMLLLTVAVDHVVLTSRMPLLAAIAIIAVWLIPAIAVPGEVDVPAFVLLAASLFLLLRLETRSREQDAAADASAGVEARERSAPSSPLVYAPSGSGTTGIAAAATGIAAVAVVVAIVATPLFSGLVVRPGTAPGGQWNSIDASLQLGDDLRRTTNAEVLQLRTESAAAPYLRVATLTDFTGDVWRPDRGRTVALENDDALTGSTASEDVRVLEFATTIQVVNLVSASAPVTFPAADIEGLDGEWAALPYNGTVVSRSSSVHGQDYRVVAQTPRPTLEQIRASEAVPTTRLDETTQVPEDLPQIIRDLAVEVTAAATTDYDALAALQRWFRSGEFAYSLDAPVEDGFDGSGAHAIAEFLEVREGYCIHFASAFALMARSLGMPARIVVGYLPGTSVSDPQSPDRVYSVMSSQLHAWPEVHFTGIGWIPFEPTNSLGSPTSFAPAAVPLPLDGESEIVPLPTPTVTSGTAILPDELEGESSGSTETAASPVDVLPWIGAVLGVLAVLAIPALIGGVRRRDLLTSARAGDAAAAWRSLQDAAIDLGIAVPPDESPRAFGARLVGLHGAPEPAVDTLVAGIEHVSYAPGGPHWQGADLSAALAAARKALTEGAPRTARVIALAAPHSLLVRPGSVYAGEGARVHA